MIRTLKYRGGNTLSYRAHAQTAEYARAHPEDPDLPEIVERVAKNKSTYLRWGRDAVGWAIYVFRRRVAEGGHGGLAA